MVLLSRRMRERTGVLVGAAFLACCGIVMNRFVMTIQTLALPTLPFDPFMSYVPELAGSGDISRRCRVRRCAVFPVVPVYDPLSSGKRYPSMTSWRYIVFPLIYEFHWTAGHIIFLGLFFAVVVVISSTVSIALLQAFKAFRKRSRDDSMEGRFRGPARVGACLPPSDLRREVGSEHATTNSTAVPVRRIRPSWRTACSCSAPQHGTEDRCSDSPCLSTGTTTAVTRG